jgi:hypothetical protein
LRTSDVSARRVLNQARPEPRHRHRRRGLRQPARRLPAKAAKFTTAISAVNTALALVSLTSYLRTDYKP